MHRGAKIPYTGSEQIYRVTRPFKKSKHDHRGREGVRRILLEKGHVTRDAVYERTLTAVGHLSLVSLLVTDNYRTLPQAS